MTDKSQPAENRSADSVSTDIGKLLLRLSVAGLMLFHGVAKINGGVGGIEGMLADAGLPTVLAYGVYVGEVLTPLLMIAGVLTRICSIIFAFNMLVAIFLGHANEFLSLNQYGGWAIELPMLYLLGAICIALLGPGRFAVFTDRGIWR